MEAGLPHQCDKDLIQEDAWIFFSLWYTGCACCACRLSSSGFLMRENSSSKTVASEIFGLKLPLIKLLKCWKDIFGNGVWSVIAAWTPGIKDSPQNSEIAQEKPDRKNSNTLTNRHKNILAIAYFHDGKQSSKSPFVIDITHIFQ